MNSNPIDRYYHGQQQLRFAGQAKLRNRTDALIYLLYISNMEGINLVVFISIYLFARLGMRLLWKGLFDDEIPKSPY